MALVATLPYARGISRAYFGFWDRQDRRRQNRRGRGRYEKEYFPGYANAGCGSRMAVQTANPGANACGTEQLETPLVYVTITLLPSLLLSVGVRLLLGLLVTGENHEERRAFLTIGITAIFVVATMPCALAHRPRLPPVLRYPPPPATPTGPGKRSPSHDLPTRSARENVLPGKRPDVALGHNRRRLSSPREGPQSDNRRRHKGRRRRRP